MTLRLDLLAVAAATPSQLGDALVPILVTAVVTLGGAWLTFRGKQSDASNWLITALREDAKEARLLADKALAKTLECEDHRREDQATLRFMQGQINNLTDELERWHREGPPSGETPLTPSSG